MFVTAPTALCTPVLTQVFATARQGTFGNDTQKKNEKHPVRQHCPREITVPVGQLSPLPLSLTLHTPVRRNFHLSLVILTGCSEEAWKS